MKPKLKNIPKWIFVFVFLIVSLSLLHFSIWSKFNALISSKTTDVTPIHVTIQEKEYWIPANYFERPRTKKSVEEQVLKIRAFYPDMDGASEEAITTEKEGKGTSRKVQIIVSGNLGKTPAPDYSKSFSRKISEKTEYSSYRYVGNEHHLFYYQANPQKNSGNFNDIYVEDQETPKILIYCTGLLVSKKRAPNPQCEMNIRKKEEIDYRISFSKEYLPHWRDIKLKIDNLFSQFEKNESDLTNWRAK